MFYFSNLFNSWGIFSPFHKFSLGLVILLWLQLP